MRRFLLGSGLFLLMVALSGYMVFLLEEGASDPFYLRLTTPKQGSLILGTSRAAQGLMPSVMNRILDDKYHYPLYNYSFTIGHSPFGYAYLYSIKKKLLVDSTRGIFVIAVDPWSISVDRQVGTNDSLPDYQPGRFLGRMENVCTHPNLDYLLNYYAKPYYEILLRRFRPANTYLHSDGWLEVSVRMDSTNVFRRRTKKLDLYREDLKVYQFSPKRFAFLKKTIAHLNGIGEVYLVRLPVHGEILTIENSLMPDFNERIISLAERQSIPYLDLTPRWSSYTFTDGNHLSESSARKVSEEVALWIKEHHIGNFVVYH